MIQPLEVLFELDAVARMFHPNLDKRPALVALARLMNAAAIRWAVTGGLAATRYMFDPRTTKDIDVVIRREDEERMVETLQSTTFLKEFEVVHHKRRWIALVHRSSSTPVDINSSPLFARLLDRVDTVDLEGENIPFVSMVWVAFTKLRTQDPGWPTNPQKRVQDRADLMKMLQDHPTLAAELRVLAEGRWIVFLEEILADLEREPVDEGPPDEA